MTDLSPAQKIKYHILSQLYKDEHCSQCSSVSLDKLDASNIDYVYASFWEFDRDAVEQEEDEFRCSGIETDIEPDWSRTYESRSMARELSDGSFVGWTYYYGGGKHGEPESMIWMERAYDLTVEKVEIAETKYRFTKIKNNGACNGPKRLS